MEKGFEQLEQKEFNYERFKFISYNIMELLKPKYDIKLTVEFDEHFHVNDNEGKLFLSNNDYFIENNKKYMQLDNLVSGLDIEYKEIECNYIFCILHELGHIVYKDKFEDNKDYGALVQLAKSYRRVVKTYLDFSDVEPCNYSTYANLAYRLDPIECWCDQFAYINFPYIWKELVKRNLV